MLSLQGLHPRKPPSPGQIRIIDPHGLLFSVGPPLLRRVKGSENSLVSRRYVYLTACVIHSSCGHLAPDTTPAPPPPGARCDLPPKPRITRAWASGTRAYNFLVGGGAQPGNPVLAPGFSILQNVACHGPPLFHLCQGDSELRGRGWMCMETG